MSAPVLANSLWQSELRQLKENWDSYGASPISEAAIRCLGQFAVVPSSDGGIQLEYHGNCDVEIDISPGGQIVYVGVER